MRVTSAADALRSRTPKTYWSRASSRLEPEVWPEVTAKFRTPEKARVFTIGSCFARNIEDSLTALGYDLPTARFSVPREEYPKASRPNSILNKYTPPAIWQEIAWSLSADSAATPQLRDLTGSMVIDMELAGFVPIDGARARQRRREIYDLCQGLRTCDLVVITLGLIEAWYCKSTGRYIQEAPATHELMKQIDDFEFHCLDFAESYDYIRRAIDLVKHHNAGARFLITTSPIPMATTFSGDDVITANMYSKSVLRAVAGQIAQEDEAVAYFPSYESVILTKDWSVFQPDKLHVTKAFVGKIVERLSGIYFHPADETFAALARAQQAFREGRQDDAFALACSIDAEAVAAPEHKMILLDIFGSKLDYARALRLVGTDHSTSSDVAYLVMIAHYAFRAQALPILDAATRRVVSLDGHGPRGLFLRGLYLQTTGQFAEACSFFERSLANKADYEPARRGLEKCREVLAALAARPTSRLA